MRSFYKILITLTVVTIIQITIACDLVIDNEYYFAIYKPKRRVINISIEATRAGFETSFKEADFYNKQTQDEKHLNDILTAINVKPGMKILDLGCGSGYLTLPIAETNEDSHVIGLDIVTDTMERNSKKAEEMGINNLQFISYDGTAFPFEDNSFDSEIRFPKKKSTAEGYEDVLARHENSIIDSYQLTQTEDEIWVTEQVNNLLFALS